MVKVISTAERRSAFLRVIAAALSVNPQASFQHLADAASIGRRTLYRIAPSHEALRALLQAEALAATVETLRRADVHRADPVDALRHVTADFIRDSALYQFWPAGEKDDEATSHYAFYSTEMVALFVRAQAEHRLKPDIAAEWMLEIYDGLLGAAARLMQRTAVEPEQVAQMLLEQFMYGSALSVNDDLS